MIKKTLLISIACTALACSKQSEEHLQPHEDCKTTDVHYALDVLPIISSNCYQCHANGAAQGGISLQEYEQVKIMADNGFLQGVITHAPGYPPMPDGLPKLSDCNINTILAWINAGAPNN